MIYIGKQASSVEPVMVQIAKSVRLWGMSGLAAVWGLLGACAQPSKSPSTGSPAASVPSTTPASAPSTRPVTPIGSGGAASATTSVAPRAVPVGLTAAASPPAPSPPAAAPVSQAGSAYFGCGESIPVERLWDESTEDEVFTAIGLAKSCARAERRRVLLEFVAPWCADCREMAKLDESPIVKQALHERFERVRINIGKWDRHEALRESFGVRALATYIVIDPTTSKLLAKTTLEPITKRGPKLTDRDWAAWLRSH